MANDNLVEYGMCKRRLDHAIKHLRKIFGDADDELSGTEVYFERHNAPPELWTALIDELFMLTEEYGLMERMTRD